MQRIREPFDMSPCSRPAVCVESTGGEGWDRAADEQSLQPMINRPALTSNGQPGRYLLPTPLADDVFRGFLPGLRFFEGKGVENPSLGQSSPTPPGLTACAKHASGLDPFSGGAQAPREMLEPFAGRGGLPCPLDRRDRLGRQRFEEAISSMHNIDQNGLGNGRAALAERYHTVPARLSIMITI